MNETPNEVKQLAGDSSDAEGAVVVQIRQSAHSRSMEVLKRADQALWRSHQAISVSNELVLKLPRALKPKNFIDRKS